MPIRKNRKAPRKSKAPYKRRARRNVKPSKTLTKMVNSIIHKNAETKQASYNFPITQFNSGVNSAGDILRVIPIISQGATENQRIGDTLLGQKLSIKGHFFINLVPNTSSTTSLPTAVPANARLMIRAFICSVKKYNNYDDAVSNAAAWTPNFLKNGNTSQALDGSIESMYLPVNTDVITVHKEIKKYISMPVLTSTSVGVPVNVLVAQSFNPSGSVKFFNGGVRCKKVMKYDDSSFSPQNFAPFMVISYAHLDGSAPDVLTTVITGTYVSVFNYEDV